MTIEYIKEQFEQVAGNDTLAATRRSALDAYNRLGIPTMRNEEWKYTRVASVFGKDLQLTSATDVPAIVSVSDFKLPGHDEANTLVFVNGVYNEQLSVLRSPELKVMTLEAAAASEYQHLIAAHYNHSSQYLEDGLNALNTALSSGIMVHLQARKTVSHPIYIYNITDTRQAPVLSQPRSFIVASQGSEVSIACAYASVGQADSLTNEVMEIVVEKDAVVSLCKIQHDAVSASQVNTTHIRQVEKSTVNVVTISLDGGLVRNHLHAIMEAPYTEAHLYGLYFPKGKGHVDNHTIVDNAAPLCLSNELYKGILDDQSTGVFNGKIFVRKDAQKINAFQSNKNILLSEGASVNTKPQLEIFADDVKCSHGCTVGSLDEEALFYLRSRGISKQSATALLLQGFAMDILEKIKPEAIRHYVEQLVAARLANG